MLSGPHGDVPGDAPFGLVARIVAADELAAPERIGDGAGVGVRARDSDDRANLCLAVEGRRLGAVCPIGQQ